MESSDHRRFHFVDVLPAFSAGAGGLEMDFGKKRVNHFVKLYINTNVPICQLANWSPQAADGSRQ